jgi:choline dehydrogenase-like flavoprotein
MIRAGLEGAEARAHETIVVGSGPAGLTLAMELARRGRPTLVLESGLDRSSAAQDLSRAEIVDPARHDDMRVATARRLGGTSNLWGGRSMPLDPIDFVPRPFAGGVRWPIGYDDVAPYYATACRYVGCGEAAFTLAAPEFSAADDAFECDRIERASNRPWFQRAHAATLAASPLIDIRLGATVVEIELAENGRATGVVAATADGRRLRLAAERVVLAAGGLESTRLLLATQRRQPALFGGAGGPLGRYYMGHVIGEIADVVFDDARVDAAFDFQRDGRGSFVRRRFAPSPSLMARFDLPNIGFWPVAPPIADPRHGSGALSAVAMALSTPIVGGMILPELIRARHLGGSIDWLAHARNVAFDLPATATFLARFVRDRYFSAERIPGYFLRNRARRYGFSYHAEQIPNPDSRVTLAAETDRLGLPRLRVDLRFSRDDADGVLRAHEQFALWLSASGFGRIEYRQSEAASAEAALALMSHGSHQIGTARMGANRRQGVVDGDLACFDAPNLSVLGSAVFPTSGQANPTLSIVAFAARLAEKLAAAPALSLVTRPRASAHA